jgi:hypothetical protein
MNLCQLQSRSEDETFLRYEPIEIDIETEAATANALAIGQELVIQLSNRKKFKAIIVGLNVKFSNNLTGTIIVKRK